MPKVNVPLVNCVPMMEQALKECLTERRAEGGGKMMEQRERKRECEREGMAMRERREGGDE